MNDFDPSLDEIVSAYVDDAATPTERALVEGDPALVERAATFRRLRAEIATPPAPADDELRRTLIALLCGVTLVGGVANPAVATPAPPTVWLCRPGLPNDPCAPGFSIFSRNPV